MFANRFQDCNLTQNSSNLANGEANKRTFPRSPFNFTNFSTKSFKIAIWHTKIVKLCLLCPSFFAQSLILVQMSRKTWTKLVRKVCWYFTWYTDTLIHTFVSLFQFWVVYFRKRNTNRCLFTSQQRGGAPSKHAHNATTITKLKNSKCQNIFRCIFDDFFFRILQWIPEEFFVIKAFWRIYAKNNEFFSNFEHSKLQNRQIWPTWKLISEFCLVVPSISRILRLKASKLRFDAKIVKPCLLCSSFSPKV